VLTTDQKGAVAELAVARQAAALGIGVWHAYTVERYDLIFDVSSRLLRVQCKWACRHGDVLVIRACSRRRSRDGLVRRPYAHGEIDAFAAYCFDLDRCYLLPFDRFAGRRAIQLRLAPSKNNQRARINWASDFELTATLGRLAGP
jgi:PD-(D/E)XK endonuclease